MDNTFDQIFGYSPLEEWNSLSDWQKKGQRGATMAPLVDAQIGYMSQQQTNQANKQIAQMQNDYNTQMWHMQNVYNSPAATMQRLTEAGINPRAYQQIGQFANAAQPHKAEGYEYNSPLGQLAKFSERAQIELAYKQLNLDKIKLTTDTLNASAEQINAYRSLDEVKRHNKANEAFTESRNLELMRHNFMIEANERNKVALESSKFRTELESMGIDIKYNNGSYSINVPQWIKTANKEERLNYIKELKQRVSNLEQDNEYKQSLNDWYEANQVLGAIAKVLGLFIK